VSNRDKHQFNSWLGKSLKDVEPIVRQGHFLFPPYPSEVSHRDPVRVGMLRVMNQLTSDTGIDFQTWPGEETESVIGEEGGDFTELLK
jgi:hypothetical protein